MPLLITASDEFPPACRGGAVAIGNFDAVHRGHAALITCLKASAHKIGGPAIVFTFDPPPEVVLRPQTAQAKPLTTIPRRAELLGRLGVDVVIAFPTDRNFLSLTAEEFFRSVVIERLNAGAMVEGPNFRFGRERGGDTAMLRRLCDAATIALEVLEPQQAGDSMISSTRVRELISSGRMLDADRLLIEPYRISGRVISGAKRGRELGFPTANLSEIPVLLPPPGVYAARVPVDGKTYPAAVNIGPNPTFGEEGLKVEVHVIGLQADLYDRTLDVDMLAELRAVKKFSGAAELMQQLRDDIRRCEEIAGKPA